jgi:hypothetical protein
MRLAAANLQPFQLDVAATSSILSLVPEIYIDPVVAAQDAGQFMPAIQDTSRSKRGIAISA